MYVAISESLCPHALPYITHKSAHKNTQTHLTLFIHTHSYLLEEQEPVTSSLVQDSVTEIAENLLEAFDKATGAEHALKLSLPAMDPSAVAQQLPNTLKLFSPDAVHAAQSLVGKAGTSPLPLMANKLGSVHMPLASKLGTIVGSLPLSEGLGLAGRIVEQETASAVVNHAVNALANNLHALNHLI